MLHNKRPQLRDRIIFVLVFIALGATIGGAPYFAVACLGIAIALALRREKRA